MKRERMSHDLLEQHFVMTICAARKSGKSYFIATLLRGGLIDKYDHVIIMCPSLAYNDDYLEFKDHEKVTCIHNVTHRIIDELFRTQSECMLEVKQREREGSEDDGTLTCPSTLLILDDCVDSGVMHFKGVIDKVAERGRHIFLSMIACSQRISAVSRSVRINSDYFMIFRPYGVSELEKYLDQFISQDVRKATRQAVLKVFKTPFQFLLLDNSNKDLQNPIKVSNAQDFVKGKVHNLQLEEGDVDENDFEDVHKNEAPSE